MLFFTLISIIGLSLWNWNRMQSLHQTTIEGQKLLNQSQRVMGLMKDIIFDLFSHNMYNQIRSLTYSPRSVATYKTFQKAVDEYQSTFMDFVSARELRILQDEELQDIYTTALTLNDKAREKLNTMSSILLKLQEINLEGESLYNAMQKDESLIPFFQEFRETSYYFTNTFESFMNHFFTSFQKQSLRLERQLYILFLIVSLASGLISILYSTLLSREIISKISLVEHSFRKISRGDFSTAYAPEDKDELSSLLRHINALSVDLKENVNSILNLTRDMGKTLAEDSSREDMMNLITRTIINDTAAETAAIYLYDPLEDQFLLQAEMGSDTGLIPCLSGSCITGSATKRQKALLEDSEREALEQDLFDSRLHPAAAMTIPLIMREQVRGLLAAFIFTPGSVFSDLGITRMRNFAEYVALSLDNHTQYIQLLEKREAEYNALQSQVQPHFIYNVLNGFIGLNRMGYKDRLEKAILSLREMLRYVTEQKRWTTIQEEFNFLTSYCELQKIRFGERLNYNLHMAPEIRSFRIPKLLLQPLIENSIIHGLEPLEEGGALNLEGKQGNNRILLILEDTGIGFDKSRSPLSSSVGLRNVTERLSMTYPGSEFQIYSEPGKGTKITITILPSGEETL